MLRRIFRRFRRERDPSSKDQDLAEIAEAQRLQHERDVIGYQTGGKGWLPSVKEPDDYSGQR